MANPVPEKLINFRVYNEGEDLIGVADVELPELEAMTETVKGAGIAGEVDSPVLGHYQALTLKLTWRVTTANAAKLAAPKAHQLDCRGSMQYYDAGSGEYQPKPVQCVMKAIPKKAGLGKLEPGALMDTGMEFEVVYLKLSIEGNEIVEIDKLNYICKIDGTDYLAAVRGDLGL
ncbi:MAG: phage major tail tube protein [Deltaproteobacteria bacterium]|nr:phage major tail tube protein [Deltaproteobacteria bacterium]